MQQGGLPGFLPQLNTWSATLPPPLQFQNPLTGETQTSNWYVPRRNFIPGQNKGNQRPSGTNAARGAAAWQDNSVADDLVAISDDDIQLESGQECGCSNQGDFDGSILLRAGTLWDDNTRKLMNERRRRGLCLQCGGTGHFKAECTKPEDLSKAATDPPGTEAPRQKLRAVFSVSEEGEAVTDWQVEIVDDKTESGKV